MPIYDYLCPACGAFSEERPMAEYAAPQACPSCGAASPRALLQVPQLAMMDGGKRRAHATNERSSHAPRQTSKHGGGCACCKPRPAAKSFPGSRPWMISH